MVKRATFTSRDAKAMSKSATQASTHATQPTAAIDLVYLARQTGGDTALEHELLALFADQCVKHLETIRVASVGPAADAAHTLKGAARAIGAWAVGDAAERMEAALRAGSFADCLRDLAEEADRARRAIASLSGAA